jgi:hypothetical protein
MRWNELTHHLDLWQQTAISGSLFEGAMAARVAAQMAVTNGDSESVLVHLDIAIRSLAEARMRLHDAHKTVPAAESHSRTSRSGS